VNADKIIAALEDGLGDHQPVRTRLRAAKMCLEIEASVAEDEGVDDAVETPVQSVGREELIAAILRRVRATT
jgi:hypothetical protein